MDGAQRRKTEIETQVSSHAIVSRRENLLCSLSVSLSLSVSFSDSKRQPSRAN